MSAVRAVALALLALALVVPAAEGVLAKRQEASFPMAQGFEDRLVIVSGTATIDTPVVAASSGFFRVDRTVVEGVSRVCWQAILDVPLQCAQGPFNLVIPEGSSFGLNSPKAFPIKVAAAHALTTFVDLSTADGFDERLRLGPSALSSLVDGQVAIGRVPTLDAGARGGITTLEAGSVVEVRTPQGFLVHTSRFNDAPLLVEGLLDFPSTFGAQVVVQPFEQGSRAVFHPATQLAATAGLAEERLDLLDDILRNVRFIDDGAKSAPFAIVAKAGDILSEVFNGAFVRTRLSDDPSGLGDVGFAKFIELVIEDGVGRSLDFDGSYTLVVGDLGPAFEGSEVSGGSLPLRWWVGLLFVMAIVAVGAWLWRRDGTPDGSTEGPQNWVARVATAAGVVALVFVWDWRLNDLLGTSVFTTEASGDGLGIVAAIEAASLLMAILLIGVPVYLIVRFGLSVLRKPRFISLSATAGVFMTLGLGILLLPALVAFLLNLFA